MAGGSKLSPFGHAIAGTGGAMFALTCTYPLDMYVSLTLFLLSVLTPTYVSVA